jgi:hypothetical protein
MLLVLITQPRPLQGIVIGGNGSAKDYRRPVAAAAISKSHTPGRQITVRARLHAMFTWNRPYGN